MFERPIAQAIFNIFSKQYTVDELREMSKKGIEEKIEKDIYDMKKELPKRARDGYKTILKDYDIDSLPTKYEERIIGSENWHENISCEYVVEKYKKAFPDLYVSYYSPCEVLVSWDKGR